MGGSACGFPSVTRRAPPSRPWASSAARQCPRSLADLAHCLLRVSASTYLHRRQLFGLPSWSLTEGMPRAFIPEGHLGARASSWSPSPPGLRARYFHRHPGRTEDTNGHAVPELLLPSKQCATLTLSLGISTHIPPADRRFRDEKHTSAQPSANASGTSKCVARVLRRLFFKIALLPLVSMCVTSLAHVCMKIELLCQHVELEAKRGKVVRKQNAMQESAGFYSPTPPAPRRPALEAPRAAPPRPPTTTRSSPRPPPSCWFSASCCRANFKKTCSSVGCPSE